MKTITAKELRDDLQNVVRRAQAGERIRVTYRSQPAFTLVPAKQPKRQPEPGSPEAMQQFLKRVESRRKHTGKPVFDPNKSIKELYHEMLDNDPKYKPPYHR
jgi:prevent-host-death family protein